MSKSVISAVNAAMKYLYPNGEPPEVVNKEYKLWNRLAKKTDFVGEWAYVPIKNANPQGVGPTVAIAQSVVGPSSFKRFTLTRNKAYGVAQVDGELAEAAIKSEGALVDMLANEINGTAQSVTHDLAGPMLYGRGDSTLGQTTGTSTGTTLTLTTSTNMNWLELGMTLGLVDAQGFATAPTARANGGGSTVYRTVTGIDRLARTVTFAAGWSDGVSGDWLVRQGFEVVTNTVNTAFLGLQLYTDNCTLTNTIYGLDRSTDKVRLSGQLASYSGQAMEDAIQDASAKVAVQGVGKSNICVANPIRISQMKRSIGGKIIYDRNGSKDAGVGFDKVMVETESGPIEVVADPYCPLSTAYLLREADWKIWSLKPAPHLMNKDGNDMLRVYNDDAWEARWRFYGAVRLENPACQFQLTNFGV